MTHKSGKSVIVSFRVSNECLAKIRKALATPSNPNSSVSDYCKTVIHRHAFRHEKRSHD